MLNRRINVRAFHFDGGIFNEEYFKRLAAEQETVAEEAPVEINLDEDISGEELVEQSHALNTSGQRKINEPTLYRQELINCNEPFLDQVIADIKYDVNDQVILMVGTHQKTNGRKTHKDLYVEALKDVVYHYINQAIVNDCVVDDYLPDVNRIYDSSRLLNLYTQMHRMASKNDDANIVFDFYESNIATLTKLRAFLANNPELIPANTTLRLNHYIGGGSSTISNDHIIQGTGFIDHDYKNNVKVLLQHVDVDLDDVGKEIKLIYRLESVGKIDEKVKSFLDKRVINPKKIKTKKVANDEALALVQIKESVNETEKRKTVEANAKPAGENQTDEATILLAPAAKKSFWHRHPVIKWALIGLGIGCLAGLALVGILTIAYFASPVFGTALAIAGFALGVKVAGAAASATAIAVAGFGVGGGSLVVGCGAVGTFIGALVRACMPNKKVREIRELPPVGEIKGTHSELGDVLGHKMELRLTAEERKNAAQGNDAQLANQDTSRPEVRDDVETVVEVKKGRGWF